MIFDLVRGDLRDLDDRHVLPRHAVLAPEDREEFLAGRHLVGCREFLRERLPPATHTEAAANPKRLHGMACKGPRYLRSYPKPEPRKPPRTRLRPSCSRSNPKTWLFTNGPHATLVHGLAAYKRANFQLSLGSYASCCSRSRKLRNQGRLSAFPVRGAPKVCRLITSIAWPTLS